MGFERFKQKKYLYACLMGICLLTAAVFAFVNRGNVNVLTPSASDMESGCILFDTLSKGKYYVIVDYRASAEQMISLYAPEEEAWIVTDEKLKLREDSLQICYPFTAVEDLTNFEARCEFDGNGFLTVRNIRIINATGGAFFHARNLFLALTLLFLVLFLLNLCPETYAAPDNRFYWADAVRGIGIILVAIGHTWNNPGVFLIYGFHMPLFFILSGYLHKDRPLGTFCIKLVKNYLLPYLLFCFGNAILRIPYMIMWKYSFAEVIKQIGAYMLGSVRGLWPQMPNCIQLWFLPALAVALFIYRLIRLIPWRIVRVILYAAFALTGYYYTTISIATGIPYELPWGQHAVPTAVAFLAIGHGLREINLKYRTTYDRWTLMQKGLLCFLLLASGVGAIVLNHLCFKDMDVYFNTYGNFFLTYIGAVAMSMFVILAVHECRGNLTPNNYLVIIGCYSVFFFAYDFWAQYVAHAFPRITDDLDWYVIAVLKLILTMLLFIAWRNAKTLYLRVFRRKTP